MYQWLGESDVDTHVYGVDDDPEAVENLGVTVHDGTSKEYQRSWVVVFTPDKDGSSNAESDHVALVAFEIGPKTGAETPARADVPRWRGVLSVRPEVGNDRDRY